MPFFLLSTPHLNLTQLHEVSHQSFQRNHIWSFTENKIDSVTKNSMEAEYCHEPPRSSEEEDELGHSVKKFKESSGARQFTPPRTLISYKDSLVGDIPGAYEQAFRLDNVWDDGEESGAEVEPLIEGIVEVKLSKKTKARIRATWSKALTVKVFGRIVCFSYLTFKINALWKPAAKIDCVNLGKITS